MHRAIRAAMCATGIVALVIGVAPAASAAAPSNDVFTGAEPVPIGFSEQLDTTEATTDADDAQLNSSCGAPATDASVWYVLEGTDASVLVDVSQSDYPAGVLVGTGNQGNLETVDCGPGSVGFFAAQGTTYYLLVVDDQSDGAGNGGTLNISVGEAPPPPTIDVTLASTGKVNPKTGVVTVTGTYTCSDADFVDVDGTLTERAGRLKINGFFFFEDEGTCDGTSHAWSADVTGDNGKFVAGKATLSVDVFGCNDFDCSDSFAQHTLSLKAK
jgi:hypothetical protein